MPRSHHNSPGSSLNSRRGSQRPMRDSVMRSPATSSSSATLSSRTSARRRTTSCRLGGGPFPTRVGRVGEHTRATLLAHRKGFPKDVMSMQLGLLLASVPEAERDEWYHRNVPAPIRLLYLLLMKRKYERSMRSFTPTAQCPRWCDRFGAETEGFEPSDPVRGLHLSRVVH